MSSARTVIRSAALAATLISAPQAMAELNANLGIVTEYVRDGISESSGNPALQAGLTYEHNSGFYLGAWSSTIDRRSTTDRQDESADLENDAFAGVYLPVFNWLAADLSLTRYTWSGDPEVNHQAYTEGGLRLLIDDSLTLGWRQTDDFIGTGFAKRSLEASYTWQLSEFSLEFYLAQHRWLEVDDNDFNYNEDTERDSYFHFRVGLDRSYGPWDFRFTLSRTNLTSEYDAGTIIQAGVHRYFNLW
ncbi:MAG: TorF family putative porin [Pseudomonadota bacterium]|nr:TorF family putative porin [Pseudomonadota bacterium]